MTTACDAYFVAAGGATVAGVIGAVCVAVVTTSVVRRGVVRSAGDAMLVAACVGVGALCFLSAFPAPAMAALRLPAVWARR